MMKFVNLIQAIVAIAVALFCGAVAVADFSGALTKVPWLASRINVFVLLGFGILGLFCISQFHRLKGLLREEMRKQTLELLAEVSPSNDERNIASAIYSLWEQRKPVIQEVLRSSTLRSIRNISMLQQRLMENMKRLADGELHSPPLSYPCDITIVAIGMDGTFVFHPTSANIGVRRPGYPFQRILDEQDGSFLWINERKSEQLTHIFPDRGHQNPRLSYLYFRYAPHINTIVIVESHVNLVGHLPKVPLCGLDGKECFTGQ